MLIIDNKFNIGDKVYLITESDKARLVLEIKITPGNIMYLVSAGEQSAWFYDFELSDTPIYNESN